MAGRRATRTSVTGVRSRVRITSIRRLGLACSGSPSSPNNAQVSPGLSGLVAGQVSVSVPASTSYASVVVPGPLFRSPATTTGNGVSAGPASNSAAWACASAPDSDSRWVSTTRTVVPSRVTSTDAQPRVPTAGPTGVGRDNRWLKCPLRGLATENTCGGRSALVRITSRSSSRTYGPVSDGTVTSNSWVSTATV
ncbi:MAG: hypothetical protein AUG44_19825 [Actinobacteria bacterium 13_1_20CM_3_71_11]|nr:MAG: hypothetical protein AUG44_19825 [Actinobacteria bacterium 13_1_20CM_3_71_11]